MTVIKYVASLGPRCHTASFLKRNQFKKESYPFDWIFSSIDMVIHCLEDDFKTFLDKSYYTIQDENSEKQQHSYYSENPSEILFNHHNPLKSKDRTYFKRCIARFKNLLARPELKMFVLFFLNYTKIDHYFKQRIIHFNKKFDKYTKNYGLLCIIQYTANKNSYRFSTHENIHFLEIYTKSMSNGVEFVNPEDNVFLDEIITNTYQFSFNDIEPLSIIEEEEEEEVVEEVIKDGEEIYICETELKDIEEKYICEKELEIEEEKVEEVEVEKVEEVEVVEVKELEEVLVEVVEDKPLPKTLEKEVQTEDNDVLQE